jgi:MFS family permease
VGGALADRLDRRCLLVAALGAWGVLALITGLFGAAGLERGWLLLIVAGGLGLADAASNPAWHTLVVDLVGSTRLVAANALAQISEFGGELIAPIAAGLVIAAWSPTPVFLVAALVLAVGAIAMSSLKSQPANIPPPGAEGTGLLEGIRGGLGYTLRTPPFPGLLAVSATTLFSAAVFPLVPLYGRDVLEVGAAGYGAMAAALGGGMMLGALLLAGRGDIRRQGRAILYSRIAWFVAMAAFALSDWFALSIALLVAMGAAGAISTNLVLTRFQLSADDRMRGRVMSVARIADSFDPLGAVLGGALASVLAPEVALLGCAAAGLAALMVIRADSPRTMAD